MRARVIVGSIALLSLVAEATEPDPPHSRSSALVLGGFEVQWEKRPHRVRTLGFGARVDGEDDAPTGELWTVIRGGTWADGTTATDTPWATLHYRGVQVDRPLWVGSSAMQASGSRAEAASATTEVQIPCPETPAAVWLRGFRLAAGDSHPNGFTVHGFGVELGEPTCADGVLRFDVQAHLHAAGVPDRVQSLKRYDATFEVDWVVIGAEKGGHERHSVSSRHRRRQIGLAASQEKMPVVREPLTWDVQASDVVSGLSGFQVAVVREGPVDGRYVRALQVQVADEGYDPELGRWTGETQLRFANAGPVTRSLSVEVSAQVTTVALTEDERSWSGRWSPDEGGAQSTLSYP